MSLVLYQRQDLGLRSAKRVVQFLNVGHPEAVKCRPQLGFGHRLLFQKKLDVREVLRVRAAHHLGEDEVKVRPSEQLQVDKATWDGHPAIQSFGPEEHVRLCKQVGWVKAALGQFGIGGVAGVPELLVGMKLVELSQREDRVHVLGVVVPGFVGGESECKGGAPL